MRQLAAVLVAIAAGLALADSSIVALALPPILSDLHTTVEGVAAVIGVYTLVLAAGILPAAWLARRIGPGHAGAIGLLVLAGASLGCAKADSLAVLLIFRAVQATGGTPPYVAAALAPSDALLDAMGFSRGRFVVEQADTPTLVVPAWAEVERVTEDCR